MSDNRTPRGRLKNGNRAGDPSTAPRCGAKTRAGGLCRQPAMKNGRCRLHGGKSPGAPRGERNGNYRHGLRTIEAIAERRHAAEVRRALRDLLRECALQRPELVLAVS
jgi:glucans biosynthesis protein